MHTAITNHTMKPERLEIAQLRNGVWNDDNLIVVQTQPCEIVLLHSDDDLIPFFVGRLCCAQQKMTNTQHCATTKTKRLKQKLTWNFGVKTQANAIFLAILEFHDLSSECCAHFWFGMVLMRLMRTKNAEKSNFTKHSTLHTVFACAMLD